MPPLFKSPLLYGLRFGQCQCVSHRPGAQVLGLRIQMRVDIRRSGNIAVPQPLLNLLHRHALFQQQAGAGVPLRYNYDKPEKPRISRVFGYLARFFILFQTEKSSREVVIL